MRRGRIVIPPIPPTKHSRTIIRFAEILAMQHLVLRPEALGKEQLHASSEVIAFFVA